MQDSEPLFQAANIDFEPSKFTSPNWERVPTVEAQEYINNQIRELKDVAAQKGILFFACAYHESQPILNASVTGSDDTLSAMIVAATSYSPGLLQAIIERLAARKVKSGIRALLTRIFSKK